MTALRFASRRAALVAGLAVATASLEFTKPEAPDFIPRPKRYVVRKRLASSIRTSVLTTFEYGEYRRFSVRSEGETRSPGSRP